MSEEKKQIITEIEEALKDEVPFEEAVPKVKDLRQRFVELVRKDHEELEKKFTEENPGEEFKPPHDEMDNRFSELMAHYNQRRKTWEDQKAHELQQNLDVKEKIIHDLEKLAETEQHIGHAFERFNELKEKWRATGPVPSSDYRELQTKYSYAIERFFYQINIYKTLKEYDLQKNLQLKLELTEKVKALLEKDSIKEVRDLIAAYVSEWDEIGPTVQQQWEKVRDDFWENVRQVHKKIADHYKDLKEKQKENLAAKEALCEEIEKLAESDLEGQKQWNKAMNRMSEIREEWKKAGFAGKKQNDKVWERYKAATDKFYQSRKGFQEEMKDVYKQHEDRKQALIERAESLKDSLDWKNVTAEMKKLQGQWKKVGPASPGKEQKLWKRFRGATNHFFEAKKAYFEGREDREKGHLEEKKAILKELESFEAKGEDAVKALKEYGVKWNSIGPVPREEKQKIEKAFNDLLKKKLKSAGKGDREIGDAVFKMKVEGLKNADNGAQMLRNEYQHIRDQLKKIESDISQYENNLGFFGDNAESNPLVKQVIDKLETSRKEAEDLRARLELLKD